MILRPASHQDAEPLARLGRESFCAAFEHLYDPADLQAFLTQVYSVKTVSEEIADPTITHRLAQDKKNGPLTGFVKMRAPSWYAEHSDAQNPIALGQLYTAPESTGRGVGAALMDWALEFARQQGHDAIQLSVWAENFGAQRFYQRYGFAKTADIEFLVGTQVDEEFLYEKRL